MDKNAIIYLLPFFISMLISLGVAFYSWRCRAVIGASIFAYFVGAEILFILGYVLELLSNSIESKVFWSNFRSFMATLSPLILLQFSLTITRRKLKYPTRIWALVAILPIVYTLLVYTNKYHHFIRSEELQLIAVGPFSIVGHELPLFSLFIIFYRFCLAVFAVSLIVARMINLKQLFRYQLITILVGILIPLVASAFYLLEIKFELNFDPSYTAISIGNLVIAWGLFHFRLFDIVPVARDRLVERMQDGVLVLDTQQRLIDLNPAALNYLDHSGNNIVGKQAEDIIPNWEKFKDSYGETQLDSFEMIIGEKDAILDVSVSVTELIAENGEFAGQLIVVHDISKQKNAERAIKQYNQKLEILNFDLEEANIHLKKLGQVKDKFVANVSHELRTPLTNIKLYHELIALQPDRLDEFLDTLSRETDRLTSLIEDLLALSRFDQGIVRLHKSSFDLNVLIREFVEDRRSLAEAKGLTLEINGQQDIPMIYADRNLTGQVLSILLTNAFNYTPENGSISVSSNLRSHNGSEWVGFTVNDTGMGIQPNELENLFTRFFRGKVGRKSGVSGTGLGLSIAKEIVDRHKGEIQVESSGVPGEGTAFKVLIAVKE